MNRAEDRGPADWESLVEEHALGAVSGVDQKDPETGRLGGGEGTVDPDHPAAIGLPHQASLRRAGHEPDRHDLRHSVGNSAQGVTRFGELLEEEGRARQGDDPAARSTVGHAASDQADRRNPREGAPHRFPKIPSRDNIRRHMGIDDLMARLDRLLNEHGLGGAGRKDAGALHDALVDLKVGLKDLQDALERTTRELEAEREQLAAAERRGKLAEEIADAETVRIAAEFAVRHRQRVDLLERKVGVQRDELAAAELEYQTLSERYRSARQGVPPAAGTGEGQPASDPGDADLLRGRLDRKAVEAAAEAQLEILKRKMGKGR